MTTNTLYALVIIATLGLFAIGSQPMQADTVETEYKQNVCLWISQSDRPEIERSGWPPFKGKPEDCNDV